MAQQTDQGVSMHAPRVDGMSESPRIAPTDIVDTQQPRTGTTCVSWPTSQDEDDSVALFL